MKETNRLTVLKYIALSVIFVVMITLIIIALPYMYFYSDSKYEGNEIL